MVTNHVNFPNGHIVALQSAPTDEFIDVITGQPTSVVVSANRLEQLISTGAIDRTIFFCDHHTLLLSLKGNTLSSCELLQALFHRIRSRSSFENLTFEHCRFTPECWKTLCDILRSIPLKCLHIRHCSVDDHAVERLMKRLTESSLATLQELSLEGNLITAVGIPYIGDFIGTATKMGVLSLENNFIDSVSVLALTQALQRRDLPIDVNMAQSQKIIDCTSLKFFLRRTHCIRRLNLNGNWLLDGLKIIQSAIAHPSLKRLSLCDTRLTKLSVNNFVKKPAAKRWKSIKDRMIGPQKNRLQVDLSHHHLSPASATSLSKFFEDVPVNFLIDPSRSVPHAKENISQSQLDEILRLPDLPKGGMPNRQKEFLNLIEKRFVRIPIPYHSDCLFTCLSFVLQGTPAEWRRIIIQFISQPDLAEFINGLFLSYFDHNPPSIASYCNQLSDPAIGAGPLEIELLSQAFSNIQRPYYFVVFSLKHPPHIINNEFVPAPKLRWGNPKDETLYFYEQGNGFYQPLNERTFKPGAL